MKLTLIKAVTVIAPRKLKKPLVSFLEQAGMSGYTVFEAAGNRSFGPAGKTAGERNNVQIKVLADPLVAHTLMLELAQKYFGKEKVILYEQDTRVIRPEKFRLRKKQERIRLKESLV